MAKKNGESSNNLAPSPSPDDNERRPERRGLDIAAGPSNSDRSEARAPEPQPSVSENPPRREENPFSFKRFLNQDRGGGARRKEYSPDGSPVIHTTSEMSSVLPDFVQDHLVVEQCYLSSSPAHHTPLPFDLPLPADERAEGVSQSLPDFLNDGPIRNQRSENEPANYLVSSGPSNGLPSPPGPSRNEVDRLQRDYDNLRRQLSERIRRIEMLESELALVRNRDARETNSLEQALQQVENNLRQCSKRLAEAETSNAKLKADNKMLKAELQIVWESQGGVGTYTQARNMRLAQDLRGAASAAETHLLSLMSGIENLRMMASTLEDQTTNRHDYDDCDECASGPAL